MDPSSLRVAGPPTGKAFVLKVAGERSCAIGRVNELLRELRDEGGAWRELFIPSAEAGPARLYARPDRSKAQAQKDITGKWLTQILSRHAPKTDFFHRR